MNSTMVPKVRDVATPGRRTLYSMCGMCAVYCPMEVTVEDGKMTWLQGNPHDKAIGTSLCAKGEACKCLKSWCARPDSNGRPADSKIFENAVLMGS